ncbi:hypothetical protein FOCC_FOCC006534 [Frankliniella occidentalis]|nr:hypothetical protein FOCC_FOCC006534 [Frankliniella occidentalis]
MKDLSNLKSTSYRNRHHITEKTTCHNMHSLHFNSKHSIHNILKSFPLRRVFTFLAFNLPFSRFTTITTITIFNLFLLIHIHILLLLFFFFSTQRGPSL